MNKNQTQSLRVSPTIKLAVEVVDKKYSNGFGYPFIKDSSLFYKGKKIQCSAFNRLDESDLDENDQHLLRLMHVKLAHVAGEIGFVLGPIWNIDTDSGFMLVMPDVTTKTALVYWNKQFHVAKYTPGNPQLITIK